MKISDFGKSGPRVVTAGLTCASATPGATAIQPAAASMTMKTLPGTLDIFALPVLVLFCGSLSQNKTKTGRANMSSVPGRVFIVMLAAAGCIAVAPGVALAQVKPAVTTLGPDFPKSEIFIGNSFFYYNNGMPGQVSQLEKAADPDHKQDYRATMVTIGGSGFDWHDVESYFR